MRRQGARQPSAGVVAVANRVTPMKRSLVFALAIVATPLAGQGKPLTVNGVRALAFGTVLPGVPRVVLRTDPVNSGQYDIKGPNSANVQLTFSLPTAMTGPGGATMPLSFGGSDAGYSSTQSITSQVGFDPKQVFVGQLPKNGRASVFLGCTAQPQGTQRAGSYTAIVTLSVTVL